MRWSVWILRILCQELCIKLTDSVRESERKMKVLNLLLAVFTQSTLAAKVFKPYSTRTMANNHAFTAMASKIDSLKFRQECIQFHLACQAGFEPADKCWKFYSMMVQLYKQGWKLSSETFWLWYKKIKISPNPFSTYLIIALIYVLTVRSVAFHVDLTFACEGAWNFSCIS